MKKKVRDSLSPLQQANLLHHWIVHWNSTRNNDNDELHSTFNTDTNEKPEGDTDGGRRLIQTDRENTQMHTIIVLNRLNKPGWSHSNISKAVKCCPSSICCCWCCISPSHIWCIHRDCLIYSRHIARFKCNWPCYKTMIMSCHKLMTLKRLTLVQSWGFLSLKNLLIWMQRNWRIFPRLPLPSYLCPYLGIRLAS